MNTSTNDSGTDTSEPVDNGEGSSGLWRRLWRLHFLAGLIIAPALIWFAVTGLVILYTDTVNEATNGHLYNVPSGSTTMNLDDQVSAASEANPDFSVWSVTPPRRNNASTIVAMGSPVGTPYNVFVDPFTGEVLGKTRSDKGLVSFANNTHGSFLPRQFTMPIPSLMGIVGEGPAFRQVEIGEVVVEVIAGWGLVLATSGLYLWWPRKKSRKRMFVPRIKEGGRPMWRDLHASSGTVVSLGLVFLVVTGLPWATFWGGELSTFASRVTPNTENFWEYSGPPSDAPKVGDLDRFGVKIAWAVGNESVPTSNEGGHVHSDVGEDEAHSDHDHGSADGELNASPARRVGWDAVMRAAHEEGMVPGFTISPPTDSTDEDGTPTFGAFVVTNPWPSSLGEQGALYVDQFSAKTLGMSDVDTWGGIQRAAELGVQTHMGTQFGLVNRIFLTLVCVLTIWSIVTATVMWLRRRRKGTIGVPRRPADESTYRKVGVVAIVLAVIYPLWGASAALLLGIDRLVRVRRTAAQKISFPS
ncbi:MAG: PepSY-associated TM helix domain-containing protein [Actinomycetota bacterium]